MGIYIWQFGWTWRLIARQAGGERVVVWKRLCPFVACIAEEKEINGVLMLRIEGHTSRGRSFDFWLPEPHLADRKKLQIALLRVAGVGTAIQPRCGAECVKAMWYFSEAARVRGEV